MKTHLGYAALALVLSSGTALTQTTIITQQPVAPEVVITGPPPMVTAAPFELTPAQRTTVYRTIVRQRPVAVVPAGVEWRVGTRVPADVQLHAIPDPVAVEVPAVRRYRYMVVNNRVVLVDPATSLVVSEIIE